MSGVIVGLSREVEFVQVNRELRMWPERARVLIDVGNWYSNREHAMRDCEAHRPTCDFAVETLGSDPRPCTCWTMERRP